MCLQHSRGLDVRGVVVEVVCVELLRGLTGGGLGQMKKRGRGIRHGGWGGRVGRDEGREATPHLNHAGP